MPAPAVSVLQEIIQNNAYADESYRLDPTYDQASKYAFNSQNDFPFPKSQSKNITMVQSRYLDTGRNNQPIAITESQSPVDNYPPYARNIPRTQSKYVPQEEYPEKSTRPFPEDRENRGVNNTSQGALNNTPYQEREQERNYDYDYGERREEKNIDRRNQPQDFSQREPERPYYPRYEEERMTKNTETRTRFEEQREETRRQDYDRRDEERRERAPERRERTQEIRFEEPNEEDRRSANFDRQYEDRKVERTNTRSPQPQKIEETRSAKFERSYQDSRAERTVERRFEPITEEERRPPHSEKLYEEGRVNKTPERRFKSKEEGQKFQYKYEAEKKFSPSEVEILRENFEACAKDNRLNKYGLLRLLSLEDFEDNIIGSRIYTCIKQISSQGATFGNYVNYERYIEAMSVLARGDVQERLDFIYNIFDPNGDGYVTKEEMHNVLGSLFKVLRSTKFEHPNLNVLNEKVIN